jgi:hypothetical protein
MVPRRRDGTSEQGVVDVVDRVDGLRADLAHGVEAEGVGVPVDADLLAAGPADGGQAGRVG